jgi:hypothetical protein
MLGELGKQIAKHNLLTLAYECEVRREVPPGQVNMGTRLPEFSGHDRQRLAAVDQDLDRVAGPHWRVAGCPPAGWRIERMAPANPSQPPPVMCADLPADLFSEPALRREQQLGGA